MKKVVFLRVAHSSSIDDDGAHQTALVLQKTADGYLSVQGRTPIAWSERHRCWELFRRAAKSLLGVCETRAVSVCLSDPPHTAVNDLATVFRQPSHIVSLTLTPLPAEEDADKTSRAACHNTEPHRASSGLYQPPRPSPLSSPQQPKKRTKLSGKEMDKLLASLDEVGQSLARTQTQCEAIARRCEGKAREDTDTAAFSDEDSRVERLLKVAETLTTRIINQQQRLQPRRSPTPTTGVTVPRQPTLLPECPTGVCVQPSVNDGGVFVLWHPVRLDDRDCSNGCRVTGYAVYVDGFRRAKVNEPFGSHTVIEGLEHGLQYQIQVSTMTDDRESDPSPPVLYRHEISSASSVPPSSAAPSLLPGPAGSRQPCKVEKWLLSSSQISTPTERFTECQDGGKSDNKLLTTPPGSTHLPDDAWSMGSSHTSGIVMDHPPSSPKMTPSCPSYYHGDGFSEHSETTTVLVDTSSPCHPRRLHFSPSPSGTPSRARSPASRGGLMGDTTIDEPLDLSMFHSERDKASTTVHLVAGTRHRGPAPPGNVQVRCKQPGHINISWTPTKRDAKGCSNGCFVLGYRVYVNGIAQISVDGPMSYEATIRWPHLDSAHKIAIHIRTRSIAAESDPSSIVVYDLILRESIDQYSGTKVKSAISSSTATLCPSGKPRPQSVCKPPPSRPPTAVSRETFV